MELLMSFDFVPDTWNYDPYSKAKTKADRVKQYEEQEEEVAAKPVFNVQEPFLGIINIQMNLEFAELLYTFLEDIDGGLEPEIWAFKKAIADPQGCRDFRDKRKKKYRRQDNTDT